VSDAIELTSAMAAVALAERIERLPADERTILESLLDRLEQGRADYGPWQVDDGRDNVAEAFDEILDAMHYTAAGLVRLKRSQRGGAQ